MQNEMNPVRDIGIRPTATTGNNVLRDARPVPVLPDEMPGPLRAQIEAAGKWAEENKAAARYNALRFWALKIPAIIVSAGSGVLTLFHLDTIAVVAAAVASLCVLVDSLNPGGALRNAHYRAYHDLRNLMLEANSKWLAGSLRGEGALILAASIIDDMRATQDRIAGRLRDAETMLGGAGG
jgi:hypothetical protein